MEAPHLRQASIAARVPFGRIRQEFEHGLNKGPIRWAGALAEDEFEMTVAAGNVPAVDREDTGTVVVGAISNPLACGSAVVDDLTVLGNTSLGHYPKSVLESTKVTDAIGAQQRSRALLDGLVVTFALLILISLPSTQPLFMEAGWLMLTTWKRFRADS